MTATYNLATDIGKIRLHINDRDTTAPKLTDEEIQYALDQKSSVGGAVVWCLQFLMAQVADPNFVADWLQVDNSTAYKSLADLLALKRQEFGIPQFEASVTHVYRPDSLATQEPDFSETQAGNDDDDVIVLVLT